MNVGTPTSSRGGFGAIGEGGRLSGARAGSRRRVGGLGRGWGRGRSRRRNVGRILRIFFTVFIVIPIVIAVRRRGGLGSRGRGFGHINGRWRGRESRRGRRGIITRTAVGLAVLFEGLTLLHGVTAIIKELSILFVLATDGKATSVVVAIILRRI